MTTDLFINLILGFLVSFFLLIVLLGRNENKKIYHENQILEGEKYALEIELGKYKTMVEGK